MMKYLSELVLRRSRAVLVVALLFTLLGGAASATLFGKLTAGGLTNKGSESGQATRILEENGQGQPNLTLVISAGPGGVDSPAAAAAGARLTERLSHEKDVVGVTSYWTSGRPPQLRSEKGDKALIGATVLGDETSVTKLLGDLVPRYEGKRDGLDVRVGGYAMFQKETTEISQADGTKGETIAFPLTMIVLVLVFGSVVAACLPLAVAVVSMMLGFGVLWVMAGLTDLSVFVVSVVTLFGLGLAIDYSLLVVNRHREELRAGASPEAAIRTTMNTAGRTVLFSAVTIALVLVGLLFFPLDAVRSMGIGGMVTALLSALGALTVLPALLLTLGPRVEKGRVFRKRHEAHAGQDLTNGFWHRLATFVMRRPVPVATLVIAFLLLLGAPFLGIKVGMPDERSMPASSEARQVATVIRTEFDSAEQNAAPVVLPRTTANDKDLPGYAAALSKLSGVARVDGPTGSYVKGVQAVARTAAHGRFAMDDGSFLSVVPSSGDPDAAQRLVHELRAAPAPFEALVGGMAADSIDTTDTLVDRLPYALGVVTLAMLVLLFLLTGSAVLPLMALALSALSLTATFGALVWIFQEGHLVSLFGDVTVTGSIASTIPAVLFALSFGLAMDYQVFMLARIREEYVRTGSGTEAVARGLERVGRMVTAAAVLISIVFLGFVVSGISYVKAYGIGLPLAVLMDATLIRGALLPALMRLGGGATWWAPGFLRRLHGRFGLHESSEAPSGARPSDAPPVGVR